MTDNGYESMITVRFFTSAPRHSIHDGDLNLRERACVRVCVRARLLVQRCHLQYAPASSKGQDDKFAEQMKRKKNENKTAGLPPLPPLP